MDKQVLKNQWAHRSIHTLDMVPKSWYVQEEMRRKKKQWKSIGGQFWITFGFTSNDHVLKESLGILYNFIFCKEPSELAQHIVCTDHIQLVKNNQTIYCWKVRNDDIEEEYPRNLQINETITNVGEKMEMLEI